MVCFSISFFRHSNLVWLLNYSYSEDWISPLRDAIFTLYNEIDACLDLVLISRAQCTVDNEEVREWVDDVNEHTVSNKKTHLANFETLVFRVYLRNHLSYKKSYLHLFTYLFEELSDKKKFSNPVTKSAEICKNAVLSEKK